LLQITGEQRVELVKWVQSRTLPAGDVFRARLILALADGATYVEIMRSGWDHDCRRSFSRLPKEPSPTGTAGDWIKHPTRSRCFELTFAAPSRSACTSAGEYNFGNRCGRTGRRIPVISRTRLNA
jgi:hypothetical protein